MLCNRRDCTESEATSRKKNTHVSASHLPRLFVTRRQRTAPLNPIKAPVSTRNTAAATMHEELFPIPAPGVHNYPHLQQSSCCLKGKQKPKRARHTILHHHCTPTYNIKTRQEILRFLTFYGILFCPLLTVTALFWCLVLFLY